MTDDRTARTRKSLGDADLTLKSWKSLPGPLSAHMRADVAIDMGWGRLVLGHTFRSHQATVDALCNEEPGRRNIAFYLRDPHVVLSLAPHRLFLDPSHTYRLWPQTYRARSRPYKGLVLRRLWSMDDARAVNDLYEKRHMVCCSPEFLVRHRAADPRAYFLAETGDDRRIIGTVTGLDHITAFGDPEGGASLWCLAVDPQTAYPGVGEALVRHLVEHFFARGRSYVDLSVLYQNRQAIRLYEKLGFRRVPIFCVKHKNPINEPLFMPDQGDGDLNPYARIVIDEARRRGIGVEVLDDEFGYFKLSLGGRSITCRESLSELTSAVAMSRCDDKRLTHRQMEAAGLEVPAQRDTGDPAEEARFLEEHGRIVVKPARGEQGDGVSVDIRSRDDQVRAIETARRHCPDVIMEEFREGEDLRVIVIDDEVVAASIRRPPSITGTGQHSVRDLIVKYNRRRAAATDGQSRTPLDDETERCVRAAGYDMASIPPAGTVITVRKTANLHSGGTIHDVTDRLHPELRSASIRAARALQIPVVGLDLIVPSVESPEYCIIEANERPGLANHEPQPTAERFLDLLFPQSTSPRD